MSQAGFSSKDEAISNLYSIIGISKTESFKCDVNPESFCGIKIPDTCNWSHLSSVKYLGDFIRWYNDAGSIVDKGIFCNSNS